jgi:enoyl-CoA hydratase/carnithine racemase
MNTVSVSVVDRVLHIRLNRPEKKNALTAHMYASFRNALASAKSGSDIRVVLISGEGESFCAGNDLADFMAPSALEEGEESAVQGFLRELSTTAQPIVAAVQGAAVGVGVTMLLHCDIVLFADDARLKIPFVDLGLVPEAASSLLLPRLLGHHRAASLFLLGESLIAAEAVACGLGWKTLPLEHLMIEAEATARRLAAKAPNAMRLSKHLMKPSGQTVAERMKEESIHFSEQLKSKEVREAITAFFEKRAPHFD